MSPIKPVIVQRRMVELGRVRLGRKGPKGEPQKLETFRFTSASRELLEDVSKLHGGKVEPWPDAPDEGYWQLTTEVSKLEIILPPVFADADGRPTVPYSQWLELWSGGGCKRRCDGVTESFTGKPCLCAAENANGERQCKPTTRVNFMLPDIKGFGVWRIESHGWNAAAEMPGTLEVLLMAASEGKFIPAELRIEQRSSKEGGGTLRYVVPVLDLPGATVRQLAAGDVPVLAVNPPAPPGPKPALPAAEELPDAKRFRNDEPNPGFGKRPPLSHAAPEPGRAPEEPEKPREVPPSERERESAREMELTHPVLPLSTELFHMRMSGEKLPQAIVQELGRELFPGLTLKELDDYDRGILMAAILTRADQIVR